MIGTAICEKSGFELIELEEAIKVDGGTWLKFYKVPYSNPSQAATQAGAKGAPAKGKVAVVDEIKPVIGKAWLPLTELQKPGVTKTSVRVFLETCASCVKEGEASDKYIDTEDVIPVFENEKTYVNLTISLSKPVVSIEST